MSGGSWRMLFLLMRPKFPNERARRDNYPDVFHNTHPQTHGQKVGTGTGTG